MSLLVNFKSSAKNKELLLKSFSTHRDFFKDLKGEDFNRIMDAIKRYTVLKMKLKANQELVVSDFFDNRTKVMEVLSEFVSYSFNDYFDTKYSNVSEVEFRDNLFSGFATIKQSFLLKETDNIISYLRELELI